MSFNVPVNVQLLALVGLSLSTWSQVERAMTDLFEITSGMPRKKARALFDGIISFEIRLSVLDRMMSFEKVDEVEAETWLRLSRRLGRFYKKRHELAHFALTSHEGEVGKPNDWRISPFMTFEKIFSDTQKTLTMKQVSSRNEDFVQLALAIDWFTGQARVRRPQSGIGGLQPIPSEPPLVPQLRALAVQILEEEKRRPRPPPGAEEAAVGDEG